MRWLFLLLTALPWLAQAQCPDGASYSKQAQVDAFPPGCTTLSGLDIQGSDITNLNALSALQSVGYLNIAGTTSLTSLRGLDNLIATSAEIYIENNTALVSLQGLNKLQSVAGGVHINNNPKLINMSGLNSLTSIEGNAVIRGNTALVNLQGLNSLQTIKGGQSAIELSGSPNLVNLSGLDRLTTLRYGILIRDCESLTNMQGLSQLTSVGGIDLVGFPKLVDLSGLEKLTKVSGTLNIQSCASFTSLQGLNQLTSVGFIDIRANPKLVNMSGLEKLSTASSIGVQNCESLTSLQGLDQLTSSSLTINTNPKLTDLRGLEKLSTSSINVQNCESLTSLQGLSQLTSGSIEIANNSKLVDLRGLESLSTVDNINIHNSPSLTSLQGLNQLNSVTLLVIANNPVLTNLQGLDQLRTVSRLSIRTNATLSVCASPSICNVLAQGGVAATIVGNAPGCNSVQQVRDNCSPLAIVTQPPAQSAVCAGGTLTAAVSTTGSALEYQWYKGSQRLSGQNTNTLSLTNVQASDVGTYQVIVSNSIATLISTALNLTLMPQSPDYQPLVDLYNSTNGANWPRKDNWLTGCTPCNWYGVTCDGNGRVTGLNLVFNNLKGTLPASLSALTSLQDLNLSANTLRGSIPASFSALTALQNLDLSTNFLEGSIPVSLSALTSLQTLNLGNNALSGGIPAGLGSLTALQSLNLFSNQLSGPLPASLGGLPQLQSLLLVTNQLSGCFPASFSIFCGKDVSFGNNPGLPGGGDFGAFCNSGTGSDSFRPVATASPNPVCAGSPVSLSVTAGTFYQWSGPVGFMATTQTPSLTATTSGVYSVTVGNGSPTCSAIASVSLTVNPLPTPTIVGLVSSICQEAAPVPLTSMGSPTGGVFTIDGSPATTLKPASLSVGRHTVVYSYTNASGCSATASQGVTIKATPTAPTIATQSGHSYPAGVSSLTVNQNTGNVVLMTSGCPGGTITWSGGNSTTLAVSTMNTGLQTFTATCQTNACTSPLATATITVVGTTLSVLHRDGNGNVNTNTLAPYLQLNNQGNTAIPYSEITLRYWLTVENYSPLLFSINYAQLGSDKVHLKYVPATTANPTATGYIEFSFDAAAGSLGAMSNSGPIQDIINKQDYSNFNQSNDYSYVNAGNFTPNDRITAYRNGQIVYGMEPGPIVAQQSLKAYLQNNTGADANSIEAVLSVTNDGNIPVNYGDLKVRYYFTADGAQPLVLTQAGYTALGSANVSAQLVTINPPLANADRYLELSFSPSLGQLAPGASTGGVTYQIRHADYSGFNQLNDYSYQGTGGTMLNSRVVVFVAGQRVFGTEPGTGARLSAENAETPLRVQVLGNPVRGSVVEVVVSGAEGQPVLLTLTDLSGRSVTSRQVERAGISDVQRLELGSGPAGMLLLRVSTPTRSQTVKVMKAE